MTGVQDKYMQRAIQLARLGIGTVAPNPMVGAVLVYRDQIIGEGYHKKHGEAHAEVHCLESVRPEQRPLISQSTLYVTLEPCSHFGKTPPCSDLIIREKIPRVVIGTSDPFPEVSGSGIEKLQKAGVDVITAIKAKECAELNKRFFTFHQKHRPYIILKWAQSSDGYIALPDRHPVRISNSYTDRVVHRWRSEEPGILAGAQTALSDNPRLTNRLWNGSSPKRLVIDRKLQLREDLYLLNDEYPTLIFNLSRNESKGNKEWIRFDEKADFLDQLMETLYKREVQSVLVEGGATLLQTFNDKRLWDEARVITGTQPLYQGIPAPHLSACSVTHSETIEEDKVTYYKPD